MQIYKAIKNRLSYRVFSLLLILMLFIVQLWLLTGLQLFGDEAFYWLESQYLDLSYAELPGWTQWMIRLGTELFGDNKFAVRSMSYLAFCSVFYALWLINKNLLISQSNRILNILVLLAMPILVLIGVMALPDVWLIFFVMWVTYFMIKACTQKQLKYWLIIGVLMACGLNVHVRLWIWMLFAGLSFIVIYYSQKKLIKSLLLISLPVSLLGLIPILIFNYQHGFILFDFQLEQRHPWTFQLKNMSFVLSQFIVITPLVLYLWFKGLWKIKTETHFTPEIKWVAWTAFLHWLFYVVMSLFADGLRTTVHWVVISYVPILAISILLIKNSRLLLWAVITGSMASLTLLIFINSHQFQNSNAQVRILDNFTGWKQLSQHIADIKKQHKTEYIIADYFMTAAELAFELKTDLNLQDSITVLSHPKNKKHGREKQLEIMGLLLKDTKSYTKKAILIIEDSTLKLQQKAKYYHNICQSFKRIQYLQTLNIETKQYHIYMVNNTKQPELNTCIIPPLFYIEHRRIDDNYYEISGWAIYHQQGIESLSVVTGNNIFEIKSRQFENIGISRQFPEIKDPNLPHNAFTIRLPSSTIHNNQLRISAIGNDKQHYLSKIYFIP